MDSQSSHMMISEADALTLSDHSRVDQAAGNTKAKIKRSDFPKDFVFGSATSAYQVEGAWNTGGKGLILSHAQAVDIYRQRYQSHQDGKIGVTNVSQWFEPLNDTKDDKEAASRGIDFMLGWFVAPIVTGDYPPTMRERVGERLPKFSPIQKNVVKGSYDFLGINYYTSIYASNSPRKPCTNPSYETDQEISLSDKRNGELIGPKGGSDWLNIVPYGIYKLLVHIKKTYNNPIIHITENGVDEVNNTEATVSQARFDETRMKYHVDHLLYVKKAMQEGVQVKSYYIWSMFDNFEWAAGYSVRFGIFYVDYVNGHLTRFPKASAIWLMNFLNKKQNTLKSQDQEKKSTDFEKPRRSGV
ncbi:beta-glucosidase-like [Olea europaea var. sylvestris]|uniref:beta-glucosidase-like n=1 Tax=Olea europaea var. sylvestris TaxID=158386 RepID=UPI000C1D73AA|nr:beta-glucosidase-like [Olea europaea var. sylvestris]